ncbi:peptidase domain-containing ABC transporter [Enterovibrio sp. ZSDZ35]|uniref:Peptidase domain-containing ABC transporter n=1 Tax=Enterovibrio qingdaonensis TaxID=2899818 RepID=A0ABT5QJ00_9GAMM|nr:peptidase domain-containing ABC transporter [Enterovibrio sp. ZSDZ35]MDD1780971.1 peptidase domain-containing ABC transporter [Enterovibrio sp. ZSDZ35]
MSSQNLNLSFFSKLPIYYQSEATECGITCLAMIGTYHGYELDVASARKKFNVSLNGTSLAEIISFAEVMGFQARPLSLEVDQIEGLQLPCILHWNMDHFVVLKKIKKNKVYLHNPALGEQVLSIQDFDQFFTGVALELTPSSSFERKSEVRSISLSGLLGSSLGLLRPLLYLFAFTVAIQILGIVSPLFTQWVIDKVLVSSDYSMLTILALGFIVIGLLQISTQFFRSWLLLIWSSRVNLQWSSRVYHHLLNLPTDWFSRRHIGDISSRFSSVSTIQQTISNNFIETILDGVFSLGILAIISIYSIKLTLIVVFFLSLYLVLRLVTYSKFKNYLELTILASAKTDSNFIEAVRGIVPIRLKGAASSRLRLWQNHKVNEINSSIKLSKLNIVISSTNGVIFCLETVFVIWMAALLVLSGEITIGMMIAFIAYKAQFIGRTIDLIDRTLELKMLRLHSERLADIMLEEKEELNLEGAFSRDFFESDIKFKNVSFKYDNNTPYVFKNVNFNVSPGESVAVTGKSGCGKTTLIKLLLLMNDCSEGSVEIAGHDIKSLNRNEYRNSIGVVMQDDQLFSGTILDNITFFDPSPDFELAMECAKTASIYDDIDKMPMKHRTLVGDMGDSLSGGQKQRIILARALYSKPKLLILDEATSHLDGENESIVNHRIKELGITSLIIAHRKETINMADRVLVLTSNGCSEVSVDQRANENNMELV